MATNQVSWGACAGPKEAPANGTVCVDIRSGTETWTCYDDDELASDEYTCTSGKFCPLFKQRASNRCCNIKDAIGCAAGHCVNKGKLCCGESNCDAETEECNEVAAGKGCCPKGRSCGAVCLTISSWTCCGGKGCSARGTCSQGICYEPSSSVSASTSTITNPTSSSTIVGIANIPGTTITSLTTSTLVATTVPEAARTDPKSACFLSTQYNSVYPTPDWFKTLPTSVQSSFASSSDATTPELCGIASPSGGMSTGATAGISIAAALGVLLLVLLALWRFRPGIWTKVFGGKKVNGVGEARFLEADVGGVKEARYMEGDMQHVRPTGELDGGGLLQKKNAVAGSHELSA